MPAKKKLSPLDTKLISAIQKSAAKAVATHLAAGANPNARDREGYMPLHTAAAEANSEIIKLLLDAGAEVNGLAENSATALGFATTRTGDDALEMVRLLIAKGANVNHQWEDEKRSTILTDFLDRQGNEEPNPEILETLLRAGADPNHPNGENRTPLMLCAGFEKIPELLELLLEHGAQVNAVDSDGRSALMYAVQRGNVGMVERLIAKGADVNHTTSGEGGNTVLTMALNLEEIFGKPSAKVLDALLRAGANPNQPDAEGWRPLHLAAYIEDVKLTELLLQAGADAKASNSKGYYPIDTASRQGNTKVMKRLLAAGSPTQEQTEARRRERL